jgi:ElaB/YqjD/DUF883 family membrane-anchored ribosome-binding protein
VLATRKAAERADVYLRENIRKNPWAYMASVAALGAIIGFVIARSGPRSRALRSECDCR